MEKISQKENNRTPLLKVPKLKSQQINSPSRFNKENDKRIVPDNFPQIKNISVKSSEIQFDEKFPDKYKIRFRKHFCVGENDVLTVRYNSTDTTIANGMSDGIIKLLDAKTGKIRSSLSTVSGEAFQVHQENAISSISCLRWKPLNDDILLASNTNGQLFQYKVSDSTLISQIKEPNNEIFAIDYNLKGDQFASAGKDSKIRIYDDATKKQIHCLSARQWVSPGHNSRIFSVKYINEDPNILISGGWDNAVYLWDMRMQRSFDSIFGVCLMGDSLDYKNGKILIGNQKKKEQLQLYDYKSRGLLNYIDWEPGYKLDCVNVYTAQFCKNNDDLILAGASGGYNQMKIFSKTCSFKPVFSANYLPKGCYTGDFANSTDGLVFGGGEGFIYICNVSTLNA